MHRDGKIFLGLVMMAVPIQTVFFVTLKLLKVITWPWIFVLSPIWVFIGLIIMLIIGVALFINFSETD